jgi:hypothetical protein
MTTWGTLKALVAKIMDDQNVDRSAEINGALRMFANHTALQAVETVTATLADGYVVEVPEDCMQIHAVYVSSEGYYLHNFGVPASMEGIGWIEWPRGSLTIIGETAASITVSLLYYAYYPELEEDTDDDDDIPIPNWAVWPIASLAAYYAHIPESVSRSNLAQWNIRIDSGDPEHNPLMKQARFLWDCYWAEIGKWPRQSIALRTA